VAHEIRNPITAAKSLVQQIAEDPTHAGNAEYAKVAVAELDRVERSVSHLLRYAREEPLSLREVDMEEVVDSALETLRERLTKTGTSVQKNLEPDTWLEADPDKLRRVLLNLLSNALEALEDSSFPSPSIEISAGANLAGNELWLRVRDNGPGIEAERLPKIFDPFHTSKERGTGLGLAITRKLVEAHGGSIDVESKLGEGTTFSLVFPRHREHGGA
jgi:signal transduction histidine kinase